ncbi:hypothetical protein D3C81_1693160 [compost metagenome]
MLPFITVKFKVWPVFIKDKMGFYLIMNILEIRIISQRVPAAIFNRAHTFRFHLDRLHYTQLVDDIHDGRLPVDGFQDSLDRLVGWNTVGQLFASNLR